MSPTAAITDWVFNRSGPQLLCFSTFFQSVSPWMGPSHSHASTGLPRSISPFLTSYCSRDALLVAIDLSTLG